MPATPAVSVIIASYNGARFVADAVNSILTQTFTDLELIVVDDGSTDGSRPILREIARRDARMRLVEKSNEGLVAALNHAISLARAPLIARLDHDDIALPHRIARQKEFLDRHPGYIAVGCLMQNISEDGSLLKPTRIRYERLQHRPQDFPPRLAWLYGPSPMIRTGALRRSGGYRHQFLASEDRDLCWRLGALGKIERLPEVLVNYRYHDSNMSRLKRRTQLYSALLSDLSAIATYFGEDDTDILSGVTPGGDYGPAIAAYRKLLEPHYPVETFLHLFQLRFELWDLPDFPDRKGAPLAILRHVWAKPYDVKRLSLLRRSVLYLARKPRAVSDAR